MSQNTISDDMILTGIIWHCYIGCPSLKGQLPRQLAAGYIAGVVIKWYRWLWQLTLTNARVHLVMLANSRITNLDIGRKNSQK
jgi:hypothetical protein